MSPSRVHQIFQQCLHGCWIYRQGAFALLTCSPDSPVTDSPVTSQCRLIAYSAPLAQPCSGLALVRAFRRARYTSMPEPSAAAAAAAALWPAPPPGSSFTSGRGRLRGSPGRPFGGRSAAEPHRQRHPHGQEEPSPHRHGTAGIMPSGPAKCPKGRSMFDSGPSHPGQKNLGQALRGGLRSKRSRLSVCPHRQAQRMMSTRHSRL